MASVGWRRSGGSQNPDFCMQQGKEWEGGEMVGDIGMLTEE